MINISRILHLIIIRHFSLSSHYNDSHLVLRQFNTHNYTIMIKSNYILLTRSRVRLSNFSICILINYEPIITPLIMAFLSMPPPPPPPTYIITTRSLIIILNVSLSMF